MAKYVPHVLLIAISTLAFLLWHLHIYPFTLTIFTHEGYAMHFFGGVLWTSFQVLYAALFASRMALRKQTYGAHTIFAFVLLLIIEVAQFFIPSRHMQWEDVAAQTAGILLALHTLLRAQSNPSP